MEAQTVFPTKSLLRPDQVSSKKDEIDSLEKKLSNKHIEDKGEVAKQLRRARQDFESQNPTAPTGDEEGRMVNRARTLLEEIKLGMCSQAEMRQNPSGAVDKHLSWERRNKAKIMEWKHIMLRLTAGSTDRDAANLEKHRPTHSSLNLDSAQIQGKQIFLPQNPDGLGVTFSSEQLALLRQLDEGLADRLGSLSNTQRARVKGIVDGIGLEPAKKAKRGMSPEQKEKMRLGREAAAARKAAPKQ